MSTDIPLYGGGGGGGGLEIDCLERWFTGLTLMKHRINRMQCCLISIEQLSLLQLDENKC